MKLAIAILSLASATAFAGGGPRGLSFDEIRDACSNPSKYQNQIAPQNLQITCEEHVSQWVPYQAKDMTLPRSRYIISSLTADKYQVLPRTHAMDVDMYTAQCPSFKEILQATSFSKATSCDELLSFKGGEQEFCAGILDKARQDNPKIVQINDSGRVVEFCTESVQQQPNPKKGK
jgi:hypothetical protein